MIEVKMRLKLDELEYLQRLLSRAKKELKKPKSDELNSDDEETSDENQEEEDDDWHDYYSDSKPPIELKEIIPIQYKGSKGVRLDELDIILIVRPGKGSFIGIYRDIAAFLGFRTAKELWETEGDDVWAWTISCFISGHVYIALERFVKKNRDMGIKISSWHWYPKDAPVSTSRVINYGEDEFGCDIHQIEIYFSHYFPLDQLPELLLILGMYKDPLDLKNVIQPLKDREPRTWRDDQSKTIDLTGKNKFLRYEPESSEVQNEN